MSIVEVLEKKGSMTDIDLLKELKSNLGEVSFRELNRGADETRAGRDSVGIAAHER